MSTRSFLFLFLCLFLFMFYSVQAQNTITKWKLLNEFGDPLDSNKLNPLNQPTVNFILRVSLSNVLNNNDTLVCVVQVTEDHNMLPTNYLQYLGEYNGGTVYDLRFVVGGEWFKAEFDQRKLHCLKVYLGEKEQIRTLREKAANRNKKYSVEDTELDKFQLLGRQNLNNFRGVPQPPLQKRDLDLIAFTNVVICVDESGSMASNDPEKYRKIGMDVLSRLLVESRQKRLGIIHFTNQINWLGQAGFINLNEQQQVENWWKLFQQPEGGGTNIPLAISNGLGELKKCEPKERKVMIVLSDGETNNMNRDFNGNKIHGNFSSTIQECRKNGIQIYCIVINPSSILPGKIPAIARQNLPGSLQDAERFLQAIAFETDGKCYDLTPQQGFTEIFFDIFGKIDFGILVPDISSPEYDIQVGVRTIVLSSPKGFVRKIRLPSGQSMDLNQKEKNAIDLEVYPAGNGLIAIFHRPEEQNFRHWIGTWKFLDASSGPAPVEDIRLAIFFDIILESSQKFDWYYQYEQANFAFQIKRAWKTKPDPVIENLIGQAQCSGAISRGTAQLDEIAANDFQPASQKAEKFVLEFAPFEDWGKKRCWAKLEGVYKGSQVLLGQTHIEFDVRRFDMLWKLDVEKLGTWQEVLPSGKEKVKVVDGDRIRIYLHADPQQVSIIQVVAPELANSTLNPGNFAIGTRICAGYCLEAIVTDQDQDKKISVIFHMDYRDKQGTHRICYPIQFSLEELLHVKLPDKILNLQRYQSEIFALQIQVDLQGLTQKKRDRFANEAQIIYRFHGHPDPKQERVVFKKSKQIRSDAREDSYLFKTEIVIGKAGNYGLSFDKIEPPPDIPYRVTGHGNLDLLIEPLDWFCEADGRYPMVASRQIEIPEGKKWRFHVPWQLPIQKIENAWISYQYSDGQSHIQKLDQAGNGYCQSQLFEFPKPGIVTVTGEAKITAENRQEETCKFDLGKIKIPFTCRILVLWKFPYTAMYAGVSPKISYDLVVYGTPHCKDAILQILQTHKLQFAAAFGQEDFLDRHVQSTPVSGELYIKRCTVPGRLVVKCLDQTVSVICHETKLPIPVISDALEVDVFKAKVYGIIGASGRESSTLAGEWYVYRRYVISFHMQFFTEKNIYWDQDAEQYWIGQLQTIQESLLHITSPHGRTLPIRLQLENSGKGTCGFMFEKKGRYILEATESAKAGLEGLKIVVPRKVVDVKPTRIDFNQPGKDASPVIGWKGYPLSVSLPLAIPQFDLWDEENRREVLLALAESTSLSLDNVSYGNYQATCASALAIDCKSLEFAWSPKRPGMYQGNLVVSSSIRKREDVEIASIPWSFPFRISLWWFWAACVLLATALALLLVFVEQLPLWQARLQVTSNANGNQVLAWPSPWWGRTRHVLPTGFGVTGAIPTQHSSLLLLLSRAKSILLPGNGAVIWAGLAVVSALAVLFLTVIAYLGVSPFPSLTSPLWWLIVPFAWLVLGIFMGSSNARCGIILVLVSLIIIIYLVFEPFSSLALLLWLIFSLGCLALAILLTGSHAECGIVWSDIKTKLWLKVQIEPQKNFIQRLLATLRWLFGFGSQPSAYLLASWCPASSIDYLRLELPTPDTDLHKCSEGCCRCWTRPDLMFSIPTTNPILTWKDVMSLLIASGFSLPSNPSVCEITPGKCWRVEAPPDIYIICYDGASVYIHRYQTPHWQILGNEAYNPIVLTHPTTGETVAIQWNRPRPPVPVAPLP